MTLTQNHGHSHEIQENIFHGQFKDHEVYFHQGFSYLSYLLKNDTVMGIVVQKLNSDFSLKFVQDKVDKDLKLKEYSYAVTETIVRNLDKILTPENTHLWNNLLSVHSWFTSLEEHKTDIYIPFLLNGNYYAIEYGTFNIHQITKKDYIELHEQ